MSPRITIILLTLNSLLFFFQPLAHGGQSPTTVPASKDASDLSTLYSQDNTITSGKIKLTVSNGEFGRPGQLSSFKYLTTAFGWVEFIDSGLFLGLQASESYPAPGTITKTSANSITFHSDHFQGPQAYPIDTIVTYTIKDDQLWVDFDFKFKDTITLDYGLECDMICSAWDKIKCYTNQSLDNEYSFQPPEDQQKSFLNQLLFLTGNKANLMVVEPNPYHSTLYTFQASGTTNYATFVFVDSEEPRNDLPGPRLCSQMTAGQTLHRSLCLIPTQSSFQPDKYLEEHPLVYFSPHKAGYDSSVVFMWDELPIYIGDDNPWGYAETEDDPGNYWIACMIKQLDKYPDLKFTWLITPDGISAFNLDDVYYEGNHPDWWATHSSSRILDFAPADYIDWLHKIRDHYYPWSKRVEFGDHGYHHSPSLDDLANHEFIFFNDFRDSQLFHKIKLDMDSLDLDCAAHVVRFPGFKYTRSALWAAIDNDYIFMDNDKRISEFYMSFYYKGGKSISSVNTCWWSDFIIDWPDHGRPFSCIAEQLDRDKIALLGGHPTETFFSDNPDSYQRFDSYMGRIFDEYPSALFCSTKEMGEFIVAMNKIDDIFCWNDQDYVYFAFNGALPQDTTLVLQLPENITLDSNLLGIDGSYEMVPSVNKNDSITYLILPELPAGEHNIKIPISIYNEKPPQIYSLNVKLYPNPIHSSELLQAQLSCSTDISDCCAKIYDIAGNLIKEIGNSSFTPISANQVSLSVTPTSIFGDNLANGVYLCIFTVKTAQGELQSVQKFAVER